MLPLETISLRSTNRCFLAGKMSVKIGRLSLVDLIAINFLFY